MPKLLEICSAGVEGYSNDPSPDAAVTYDTIVAGLDDWYAAEVDSGRFDKYAGDVKAGWGQLGASEKLSIKVGCALRPPPTHALRTLPAHLLAPPRHRLTPPSHYSSPLHRLTPPPPLHPKRAWRLSCHYFLGPEKQRERDVESDVDHRNTGDLSQYVAFLDVHLSKRYVEVAPSPHPW